jgi:hypothetical protein
MKVDPLLMCGKCSEPTLHIFVERRSLPHKPGELAFVELVYACDRCGRERIWGSEPREETAYGRRLAKDDFVHAIERHGLHRARCAACGGSGIDCAACADQGQTWVLDRLAPCGPTCPIAELDSSVDE